MEFPLATSFYAVVGFAVVAVAYLFWQDTEPKSRYVATIAIVLLVAMAFAWQQEASVANAKLLAERALRAK